MSMCFMSASRSNNNFQERYTAKEAMAHPYFSPVRAAAQNHTSSVS